MEFEFDITHRGFGVINFKDRYDYECSIQQSSLATEDAIWFGLDSASPSIMESGKGWVPYAIPDEVSLNTRMHLTREQVKEILPILQYFVETGELPDKKE